MEPPDPNSLSDTQSHAPFNPDDTSHVVLDCDDGMEEIRLKSTREPMIELPDQAYYYRALAQYA